MKLVRTFEVVVDHPVVYDGDDDTSIIVVAVNPAEAIETAVAYMQEHDRSVENGRHQRPLEQYHRMVIAVEPYAKVVLPYRW